MTQEAHLPGACPPSSETIARVRATVYGPQIAEIARVLNYAALDNPAQRFGASDLPVGTSSFSYTPSATPAGRYLRVMVWLTPASGVATTGTVTLTVRDELGNSLTGAVATIPLGFRGESVTASSASVGTRFDFATRVSGDFDVPAMAATLTGDHWSWEFTTTLGGGSNSRVTITAYELPRFVLDTAETYGALPGAYLGGAEIDDDAATGTERLLTTLVGARTTERTYLSLAWPEDTSATIPQVASTSYVALTNLDEGGSPETWRVLVRRIAAASADGEACRFRVLYRFDGGVGTETANVRMLTGSSSSPFVSASLPYTTSWTWSPWKAGLLATDEAGIGIVGTDTIGFEAKVSASGPTLYLAAIHVLEDVT